MKTSREQFEEWFPQMVGGMPENMVKVFDAMLFMAWQASREAIEITLPDCDDYQSTWQYQDAAELKIKGLGLSVK
jgi:hypothetical protein